MGLGRIGRILGGTPCRELSFLFRLTEAGAGLGLAAEEEDAASSSFLAASTTDSGTVEKSILVLESKNICIHTTDDVIK